MTDIDIPIWDDPDVQRIYDLQDGQPWPRFADFNEWPEQFALVRRFIEADQNAGSNGPPSAFIDACLAGVHAVERLPRSVDRGWIKFFVYFVDVNNHFLWDLHHAAEEVAAIAEWTVQTIHRNGWGPDGNATALGQRHSNAMSLAAQAGGGVHQQPDGTFAYGDGEAARRAAERGGFGIAYDEQPREEPVPAAGGPASDWDRAIDTLQARMHAAEGGDEASRLFVLGLKAQADGDGGTAISYLEEAASLGDTEAMIEAGDARQISGDLYSAQTWYEAAAESGAPRAAMSAGMAAYKLGDHQRARRWFIRATELGLSDGFAGLVQLADDSGMEQDERTWAQRGAERGNSFSMARHAYFLLIDAQQASPDERFQLLKQCRLFATRAGDLGEVSAMYCAGLACALLGDDAPARDWLQKADAGGHANASAMLTKLGLA